jgi:hypothetical protein
LRGEFVEIENENERNDEKNSFSASSQAHLTI